MQTPTITPPLWTRRLRTALFTPADDPHKCARAWSSGADAVILDLEDAIAPAAKADARAGLAAVLADRDAGPTALVRINAIDSHDGRSDLEALAGLPVDGVVVPKASAAALAVAADLRLPLIALVETAAGILDAERLARAPEVALLMLGPVDLAAELGCEPLPDGAELLHARSRLVLAAAAAGLPAPLDGPCVDFRDDEALRAEAARARALGFGGKACIHPRQVDAVAAVFAPSAEQVAWARRVLDAFAEADAASRGVVAMDGQMVDAPVVRRAEAILERSGDGR